MVQPVSDACKHRVLARSKLPCIRLDSPFLPPHRPHLLSLASRDLEPWTQPLICVIPSFDIYIYCPGLPCSSFLCLILRLKTP